MAGYIFALDNIESLRMYSESGIYATKVKPPNNNIWARHQEGTFADYVTMKPGDNIYFFIDRKIYGIGELVNIGNNCTFCNYPQSTEPNNHNYMDIRDTLLWDEGEISVNQRWVCTFKPSPYFFTNGIDIDDVLSSNPNAFRMLRAFWKLSFIKFDDIENQAFKDILLKSNNDCLNDPTYGADVFNSVWDEKHEEITEKIGGGDYSLNVSPIISSVSNGDSLRHEMAIEAGILYQISNKDEQTLNIFGDWDYLTHQVVASPFKPIDYMDRTDIFGYKYLSGYYPTRSKYLLIELKKDNAVIDNIDQLMKYVDWIKDEYTYGDYGMIDAYLIAYNFNNAVIEHAEHVCKRRYIMRRRPAISMEWNNYKLIRYRYVEEENKLGFQQV